MLNNREMVNSLKWDFLRFFLPLVLNCVTAGTRNMPIEYMFSILVANNKYIKSISSHKNIELFSSVFQNIIPNNTIPTYQEVDGVSQSHIFLKA